MTMSPQANRATPVCAIGEGNGNPPQCSCLVNSMDEEFHEFLVGCGPWGCKELDTTEQLTHTLCALIEF